MSSWGNNDNAANAPYWAVNSTVVNGTNVKGNASEPTAANVALLYGNTTVDVYTTNATIGLFGVDNNEATVTNKGAHTGWVLRTEGTGGRAGRIQQEVLVALNTMTGDNEDVTYKDTVIAITTQPANNTAIAGVGNTVAFSVVASGTPTASLTYYWQYNTGSAWANTSGSALFTGNTSTTLTANATTDTANTYLVRVIVNAPGTGAAAVTSSNATITITA